MTCRNFFTIALASLILQASCSFAATVWNFRNRTDDGLTAPWGEDHRVYDDEYGNSDVWHFIYGPEDDSNPANYQTNLTDGGFVAFSWNTPYGNRYNNAFFQYGTSVEVVNQEYDMILAFVSPVQGVFDVFVEATEHSSSSDGQIIYLQKNATVLTSNLFTANEHEQFTYQVELEVGDILYFRFNENVNENSSWDHLYLNNLTITEFETEEPAGDAIPEPTSMVLLGLGVAGLIRKKIRK